MDPAGFEPAQSPLGTGIGESMSPLRLPIRTLCLPSSQSETTFQLQRMSPPGSDTLHRCHALPGRAAAGADSPTCRQSVPGLLFSCLGARGGVPL